MRRFVFARAALFFVLFLPAIILALPGSAYAAFGISPPFLNADYLVPGIEYRQTFYLVQDRPDVDLPIRVKLEIPDEAKPWITIDPGLEFTIPAGMRQFPVQATVQIPQDAPLGIHRGTISFTTLPTTEGQVTIALGVQALVNLRVGNEAYEKFSVPIIKPMDIEEGWDPRVYVKFVNEGNVPEKFDTATFDLYDGLGDTRLAYIQKEGSFPETKAFTTTEYSIEFPSDFHLGQGQYWGAVTFYQRGEPVAGQRGVFNVLAPGSLGGFASLARYWIEVHQSLIAIFVAILLLTAGWFIQRRRRAK